MIDNLSKHRLQINTKLYLNPNQYRPHIWVKYFIFIGLRKSYLQNLIKKSYNEKVDFIAVVIKKKNSLKLYDDYIHFHTSCSYYMYRDYIYFMDRFSTFQLRIVSSSLVGICDLYIETKIFHKCTDRQIRYGSCHI